MAAGSGVNNLKFLFRPLPDPLCDNALPESRMEEDEKREQLQSSGQHIEHQHPFGKSGEDAEAAGGTYFRQSGSDIVQCGQDSGKICGEIPSLDGDKEYGGHQYKDKGNEIDVNGTNHIMLHRFSFKVNFLNAFRMDIGLEFLDHSLDHNDKAGYLDTASRTSGTGAAEHQEEKGCLTYRGPGVKIHGGESGCGHDGRDLEGGVCQRLEGACRRSQQADKEYGGGGEGDDQIVAHLLY